MSETDSGNINGSIRPLHSEMNLLTRSDGSAILSQGDTTVMASVNGPLEVKLQHLDIDKAHIEVHYSPKAGQTNIGDRFIENIFKKTFGAVIITSLHPRTTINIQLQEMEDNGGLLACGINAVCLALINSGIEMHYLVAAIHCVVTEEEEIILDPDIKQMKDAKASLTFSFDSVEKNVTTSYAKGEFSMDQYIEIQMMCRNASEQLFEFYKNSVKSFSKAF